MVHLEKNVDIVRTQGLRRKYMKKYNYPEFRPGGKYYNQKVLWLTTKKRFARSFTMGLDPKANIPIVGKKYIGPVLLVKTETKFLDYLNPTKVEQRIFDEYLYLKDIPPRDILWPEDPMYTQLEKQLTYLRDILPMFDRPTKV